MGLFDFFDSDYRAGFQFGRQLRDNPAFAKQFYDGQRQAQAKQDLMGLLGNKVDLGQQVPNTPTKYGDMDFNVGGQEVPKMEGFKPGSGLLGGEYTPIETAVRMMSIDSPIAQQTGGNLLQQAFKPQSQGLNIVGSPLKLKNGNFGYLDGRTGQITDTGKPFNDPYKDLMINDVPYTFNRRTGQIAQPEVSGGNNPITHEVVTKQKADEATAVETAKSNVKSQDEINKAASLAEGAVRYVQEARKLAMDMSDKQLGPIANMTPNFTGNAQLLEMQLNNLIGNVREKLPGILSDSDIKLLKSMIPNMGMDKEPLLKALDMFESELQRIIQKKTGVKLYPGQNNADPVGIR